MGRLWRWARIDRQNRRHQKVFGGITEDAGRQGVQRRRLCLAALRALRDRARRDELAGHVEVCVVHMHHDGISGAFVSVHYRVIWV